MAMVYSTHSVSLIFICSIFPVEQVGIDRRSLDTFTWSSDYVMTSSHGNIFRVTGYLCGEFTSQRWIHKGQWRGALMFPLIYAWINGWVNNREAGDWRRHRGHYDVTVMFTYGWSPDLTFLYHCNIFLWRPTSKCGLVIYKSPDEVIPSQFKLSVWY